MESYNIEYKSDMPKPKSMKAEIVSFLNSNTGGTIYLGANDDGQVVEFSSEKEKQKKYKDWEETLNNWIVTAFRPEVTGLIMIDPNSVPFVIAVSSGTNKPYYFTDGEGFNSKGIYIRNGSSKRKASDAEIRRMMNRHIANSYDGEITDFEELNFDYTTTIFKELDKDFDAIRLGFKKASTSHYNNAALIVSDHNPYISKLAVFNGLDTLQFNDKKLFEGPIVKQIDDVLQYIHLNNKTKIIIGHQGKRIENYSYPIEAIREAVVNAFVHRDYTMTSDIKIEIFDDRLSISSPGSLPDGLSVEDIKQGANAKRNPILINALDKMDYIENYGSGIRRIYAVYKGFKKQPELIATHNLFTVVLYNKNYKLNNLDGLNDKAMEIIAYLKDGRYATRLEIQKALGLQKSYTAELISTLKKSDIISSEGRGPATKYYLLDF